MDFHMKQERNQKLHESEVEQHPCAKMPELGPQSHHQHYDPPSPASASALPLFLPEPKISTTTTTYSTNTNNLSPFPHAAALSKLDPRTGTGNYFSLGQWQELELQALIYRYMLAGSAVPPELLLPIKQSLLLSHPSFHFHPALMQSGYWGRVAMDPEPGRCRRTDGKKWRCSKEVVGGHKYCDRHMHRGRNRSRKPVETTTPAAKAAPPHKAVAGGNHFSLSGPSPSTDLPNLGKSWARSKHENKGLLQSTSEGHVLRHFIDDWPHETDGSRSNTSLSIASDVSLKLSTGVGDEHQVNWGSMGGPLAEALRSSSTSTASPTSVLHHLPRSSVSDTSYV